MSTRVQDRDLSCDLCPQKTYQYTGRTRCHDSNARIKKRSLQSFHLCFHDVVPCTNDDLFSSYRCARYVRVEEASASIREECKARTSAHRDKISGEGSLFMPSLPSSSSSAITTIMSSDPVVPETRVLAIASHVGRPLPYRVNGAYG